MFFYSVSGFLLSGWLPGDPRPFPNERSLNSHILHAPKTLIGQDLTHFYLTQSLGMHLFKRPTIYARCWVKESPSGYMFLIRRPLRGHQAARRSASNPVMNHSLRSYNPPILQQYSPSMLRVIQLRRTVYVSKQGCLIVPPPNRYFTTPGPYYLSSGSPSACWPASDQAA